MSETATSAPINVVVDVRFTTSGQPLAIRYDGRVWTAGADSFHWFTRAEWWNTGQSAAKGTGDLVNVEHWQVQVRTSSRAELRTFNLRRDPLSPHWLLESITG